MTSNIYPKLHLPPYFYEEYGGEEMLEMKGWFGAAFVEFAEGTFVQPVFISLERVESETRNQGYYYSQEDIILAEFTLKRIKEVLPELAQIGAFNTMTRYSSLEWK